MKRFLPVGSVVLLKDSTKRVMIIGVKQVQEDGTEWDYSGCLYPEGVQNTEDLFIFNEDQIDLLFFIGFQDNEGLSFLEALSEAENNNYDTLLSQPMSPDIPPNTSTPDTPAPDTSPYATSQSNATPPDIPTYEPPPITTTPTPPPPPPPPMPPPPAPIHQHQPSGMKACPGCGNQVSEGTRFCGKCGHRF